MILETESIKTIARNILVSDILKYIEEHSSEYEEFLENERKEAENENTKFKESKTMDKLELSTN
jgi:hypothetical protein